MKNEEIGTLIATFLFFILHSSVSILNSPNPPHKRITRLKDQLAFASHIGRAFNGRVHTAIAIQRGTGFEDAANDALLMPQLLGSKFIGDETATLALVPVPQGERS